MRPRSESIPARAAIAVPPTPIRCTRLTTAAAGTRARRAAVPASSMVDCFHDEVVNFRAELANRLVVALRMDPVGEHRNGGLAFGIDPDRSAGESEVTHGAAR